MPKRTYKPSKRKRARKFGFLAPKKKKKRTKTIISRRKKGRKRLSPK